jgi:hypothetical protein
MIGKAYATYFQLQIQVGPDCTTNCVQAQPHTYELDRISLLGYKRTMPRHNSKYSYVRSDVCEIGKVVLLWLVPETRGYKYNSTNITTIRASVYKQAGVMALTGDFSRPSRDRQSNVAPHRSMSVPSCRTFVSSSTCNTHTHTHGRGRILTGWSWYYCLLMQQKRKTAILKNPSRHLFTRLLLTTVPWRNY